MKIKKKHSKKKSPYFATEWSDWVNASVRVLGKFVFGSRQLKVTEMHGRAGAKKNTWNHKETQRRSGRRPNFAPLETNGRAEGNQKRLAFQMCLMWTGVQVSEKIQKNEKRPKESFTQKTSILAKAELEANKARKKLNHDKSCF